MTTEAINLKTAVKDRVNQLDRNDMSWGNVRARVVHDLATREIERRTDLLHKSLVKRDTLSSEASKIKAKVTGYTEANEEIKSFSKADFESRQKLVEKLAKLDKAIDAVISDPNADNYGKLKQATEKS